MDEQHLRLRSDLEAVPVEAEGVACVDVSLAATGSSFRFYDFEYAIAQAFDGRSLEEIASWAGATFGFEATVEGMREFAQRLADLGFLEPPPSEPAASALEASAPSAPEPALPDSSAPLAPSPAPARAAAAGRPSASHAAVASAARASSVDAAFDGDDGSAGDDGEAGAPHTPLPEALATDEWMAKARTKPGDDRADEGVVDEFAAPEPSRISQGLPANELALGLRFAPRAEAAAPAPATPELPADAFGDDAASPPAPRPSGRVSVGEPGMPPRRSAALPVAEPEEPEISISADPAAPDERVPIELTSGSVTMEADEPDDEASAEAPGEFADTKTIGGPSPEILPDAFSDVPAAAEAAVEAEPAPAPETSTGRRTPTSGPVVSGRRTPTPGPVVSGRRTPTPGPVVSDTGARRTPPPLPVASVQPEKRAADANTEDFALVDAARQAEQKPGVERRQPPAPDAVVMETISDEPARTMPVAAPGGSPTARIAPLPRKPGAAERARPAAGTASAARKSGFPIWALLLILAVAAAAGAVGYVLWRKKTPEALSVRVVSPTPRAVYKWFERPGQVSIGGSRTLSFDAGGKVLEVLPPGTRFKAGEIVAKLDGAKRVQVEMGHIKERLAFYEQMQESMKAANNKAEARQAELKIAEKKRLLAEAEAALGKTAVVASEGGEVAEALVKVGDQVGAGAAAVKVKGADLRAVFTLSSDETAAARRLDFCRIEIEAGRTADCRFGEPDAGNIVVELGGAPGAVAGKPVRLGKARFEAVFPLPPSAIVRVGDTDRVYVAGPRGRAEVRLVSVADRSPTEVMVSQGIDIGDSIIVDVPPGLQGGTPVRVDSATRQ